jgi:hypothetical protein
VAGQQLLLQERAGPSAQDDVESRNCSSEGNFSQSDLAAGEAKVYAVEHRPVLSECNANQPV